MPTSTPCMYPRAVQMFKWVTVASCKFCTEKMNLYCAVLCLQYYNIPRVSFRDLVWEAMLRGRPGYNITDLLEGDERHPTDFGHACVFPSSFISRVYALIVHFALIRCSNLVRALNRGESVGQGSGFKPNLNRVIHLTCTCALYFCAGCARSC